MDDFNIPVRPRKPGEYELTEQDKEYIKSFAVDGVIPFDAYIRAMNTILNKGKELYIHSGTMLPPDELKA